MREDSSWLRDIYDSGRLVQQFIDGVSEQAFVDDARTHSAVLHRILIMGEATKRLSSVARDAHPEIDWRGIAGMRDKLIHDYHQVRLRRVWLVATRYVPKLMRQIEPLLEEA